MAETIEQAFDPNTCDALLAEEKTIKGWKRWFSRVEPILEEAARKVLRLGGTGVVVPLSPAEEQKMAGWLTICVRHAVNAAGGL